MTRQSKAMLQAVEKIKRKAGVGTSGRGVKERLEENMMKSETLAGTTELYLFLFFFTVDCKEFGKKKKKNGKHRKTMTIE